MPCDILYIAIYYRGYNVTQSDEYIAILAGDALRVAMPTLTVADIAQEVLDQTVNSHEHYYLVDMSKRNNLVARGYSGTRIMNGLIITVVPFILSAEGSRYVPGDPLPGQRSSQRLSMD